MAILNLEKIVFTKTIIGITCKRCGGNLKAKEKKSFTEKIITVLTLGTIKTKLYQCERCKKFHTVI